MPAFVFGRHSMIVTRYHLTIVLREAGREGHVSIGDFD